jgi:hypothetical protein
LKEPPRILTVKTAREFRQHYLAFPQAMHVRGSKWVELRLFCGDRFEIDGQRYSSIRLKDRE